MGAGQRALLVPAARAIEVPDEDEQTVSRDIDVSRGLGNVVGQGIDRGV